MTNSTAKIESATAETPDSAKERVLKALGQVSGINDVEKLIHSKLKSDAPKLHEVSEYLLNLGGKRMRPILALLSYSLFTEDKPNTEIIDVSAGIELIHAATLLHDDIIDKSPKRRNQTSPYLKYGVPSTLLSGDFLLVRAFSLCARLDRFIIDETEIACIELTEGEILETPLYEEEHSVSTYINIARKKTAALFRLAALSGSHFALIGDAHESAIARDMGLFGENLGIAFQILDDILDVTADENLLGKKSGVDILERKPTAVNVLWLENPDELSKRLLQEPEDEKSEDAYLKNCIKHLNNGHPAVEKARSLAVDYAGRAHEHLDSAVQKAPHFSSHRLEALKSIIDYTLERIQ